MTSGLRITSNNYELGGRERALHWGDLLVGGSPSRGPAGAQRSWKHTAILSHKTLLSLFLWASFVMHTVLCFVVWTVCTLFRLCTLKSGMCAREKRRGKRKSVLSVTACVYVCYQHWCRWAFLAVMRSRLSAPRIPGPSAVRLISVKNNPSARTQSAVHTGLTADAYFQLRIKSIAGEWRA